MPIGSMIAAACFAGFGVAHYAATRATPVLLAGCGVGAAYAAAGLAIDRQERENAETGKQSLPLGYPAAVGIYSCCGSCVVFGCGRLIFHLLTACSGIWFGVWRYLQVVPSYQAILSCRTSGGSEFRRRHLSCWPSDSSARTSVH
jgi:hypothetical protein